MMTNKTSVAYRLSSQAIENLEIITQATGANKTASIEMALAFLANQLKGKFNMTPKHTLIEILATRFKSSLLHYTGSIFGTPDEDTIMTGEQWAAELSEMISDMDENIWLETHPDIEHAPDGGFYLQSGDIWHRGPHSAAEQVFVIL